MTPPGEQQPQALGSRYELEERLGVGAMGEVWRALDRQTGRFLAAKVLRSEYARDALIVTRFIQERSILLNLTHPNIVRVRDLVVEGERLAIVMDLVEGGDLRKHLRERGPVAAVHAVPLVCVVLDALASAHESGCLHRDVKPDNVLLLGGDVTRPQDARLSDFSIARLAHESTVQSTGLIGTPGYMPPELFRDGQFSVASDVYAAGVLLYELLGGRTPFAGSGTAHTIGNRHVSAAPPPLPVDPRLWEVVARMLAKDPRARLRASATAAALRELPADALASEPLPVQPVPDSWQMLDQTVVRGASLPGRHAEGRPDSSPDTGSGSHSGVWSGTGATVAGSLHPQDAPTTQSLPGRGGSAPSRRRDTPTRWAPWVPWAAGVAAAVVVVGATLAVVGTRDGGAGEAAPTGPPSAGVVTAQLTDPALPLGLTIDRSVRYDPADDRAEVTITYSAGSAPVAGPFLEVLVPAADGGACPLVAWEGADQPLSTTTTTGVRSDCPGYAVEVPPLDARGREQVTAVVSEVGIDLDADPNGVQAWLEEVSGSTGEALAGSSVRDDQFPVQRTTGIWVEASPFRVAILDEVRVEVGAVFVTGERGQAFFDSVETTGPPSLFLQQVAGGYDGVRVFGCPAVQVNAQLRVSARSPAADCSIGVEVARALSSQDSVAITGAGS